jgi:hypothetical protein
MALNQLTYHVKGVKTGHFNITSGTTINTNTDGTGTLNRINFLGTSTAFATTDKMQIRKITVALNGNLATATAIRFFKSTSDTAPSATNTVYLGNDILLPVTTFAATTAYSASVLNFSANQFVLGPGEYLYCTVTATITNGADVIVEGDDFAE